VPNIFKAEAGDFIKATQRVYRSKAQPTRLEVLVLPAEGAPAARAIRNPNVEIRNKFEYQNPKRETARFGSLGIR
jgi:hypothetical protein